MLASTSRKLSGLFADIKQFSAFYEELPVPIVGKDWIQQFGVRNLGVIQMRQMAQS